MEYQIVFTATDLDFNILFITPVFLFVGAVLFLIIAFKAKIPDEKNKQYFRIFSIVFTIVTFIIMVSSGKENYKRMTKFENIFQNKMFKTAEGEITDYKDYKEQAHVPWQTKFSVNEIEFEYYGSGTYKKNKQGKGYFYNYPGRYNGPIKMNGQKVRILYVFEQGQNKIIQVEIKKM